MATIFSKIIAGEIPSVAKQRSSVPENVDALTRKALEKDTFAVILSDQKMPGTTGTELLTEVKTK